MSKSVALVVRILPLLLLIPLAWACGSTDGSPEPVPPEALWPDEVVERGPGEVVDFAERSSSMTYGLPRGEASLADLIALFPPDGTSSTEPDIFLAPGVDVDTDQCRGGAPRTWTDLPMEIEAVVTLYPRVYYKVAVCSQDERNYGSFTIEDDTGGIVVLRDSRVTPWSFGDRIKLTVRGAMFTFGADADTRAILIADIEPIDLPRDGAGNETTLGRKVLYSHAHEAFDADDVAKVKRVEGYVHGEPSSMNFNALVLTSELVEQGLGSETLTGVALNCALSCQGAGRARCPNGAALADACADRCLATGATSIPEGDIPVCWLAGIDSELGRRGVQPKYGEHLRLTGPVVNNFDRQMLLISTAQIEYLD